MDADVNVMVSHDLVDNIEHRIGRELDIIITAHLDPINVSDPNREHIAQLLNSRIAEMDNILSFHDLRLVPGPTHTNVIFDVVVDQSCKKSEHELQEEFNKIIKEYGENFFAVIDVDKRYVKM